MISVPPVAAAVRAAILGCALLLCSTSSFAQFGPAIGPPSTPIPEKRAIIFLSPGLGAWDVVIATPRVMYESGMLQSGGYQVYLQRGDVDNIGRNLINEKPVAISYFGHGTEAGASMEYLNGPQWRQRMFAILLAHYQNDLRLPHDEAFKRADSESTNFGLELFRNHSCYSLKDTSVAEQFVKPGGVYAGVPASYVPCPTPRQWLQDTAFFLQEYRLPQAPSGSGDVPASLMDKQVGCATRWPNGGTNCATFTGTQCQGAIKAPKTGGMAGTIVTWCQCSAAQYASDPRGCCKDNEKGEHVCK